MLACTFCDRVNGMVLRALSRAQATSADRLRRQAAEAVSDGTASRAFRRLSKLGSQGRHLQNCERDLWAWVSQVGLNLKECPMYFVDASFRHPGAPPCSKHMLLVGAAAWSQNLGLNRA